MVVVAVGFGRRGIAAAEEWGFGLKKRTGREAVACGEAAGL